MTLYMGENEILREYRQAENKRVQVQILADLNCCTRREMAQFLAEHGEEVDKRLLYAGVKKRQTKEETAPPREEPAPETGADAGEFAEDTNVPDKPEPAPPGMTVATLREMLAGVAGEGLILVGEDMAPVRRAELTAVLDAQGERIYCHLALLEF